MTEVRLEGISKRFEGGVEALAAVDLVVPSSAFLVLVGPSGCGKSTLLRIVAGLEEPTSGAVRIDGRDVTGVTPAERDIAMVFQSYALYPHMTAFDNMAYGLRNRRSPKTVIKERISEAARMLELAGLLGRRPKELSGGQRQRVAMGRAIVRHPKVFLFDEPLSNLDAKLRVGMRVEIKELHRRLGITAIYVTHDQVEAMTLADRLVVLNAGRIEQIGTPSDLYKQPASKFVAGFLGSPAMNFLDPGDLGHDPPKDQFTRRVATVGLRPESLSIKPFERAHKLTGSLDLVENLGADHMLYVRLASGARVTARASTSDWERYGSIGGREGTLDLFYHPSELHLFDAEERRIESADVFTLHPH